MAIRAATKELEVTIPQINLHRMVVTIRGTSPLLTNRFGERSMEKMQKTQSKAAKLEKAPREPDADFREHLHVIDEAAQRYGFPAVGLKKALVAAGGRFASEKMTVLRGTLNIEATLLEIQSPPPTMRSDRVRLSNGSADIAYRPEFADWKMQVPVVYNADITSDAQVLNLFNIAGFAVGIGCWRPESNGTFGQFTVESAEVTA